MKRYFIFQFACFGDCLYATTIARQIKHDDPQAHVTWAIAKKYRSILLGNPDVDEVMELEIDPARASGEEFARLEAKIDEIEASGRYDQLIHSQVLSRRHMARFYTTLRHTVFGILNRPITVDISPVVKILPVEKENVDRFVRLHALKSFSSVVLFECSPASGQSKVNLPFALEVARVVTRRNPAVCFVLSCPGAVPSDSPQIVGANSLSFRENAELSRHCSLLVGCSSGITWLCTSTAAKKLPMIQLLSRDSTIFAGVKFDFQIHGVDSSHIVEMTDYTIKSVAACIELEIREGILAAKERFDQVYRPGIRDLRNYLRRLAWLGFSAPDLYRAANSFLEENTKAGNKIQVESWMVVGLAASHWLLRRKYLLKEKLKMLYDAMRPREGDRKTGQS